MPSVKSVWTEESLRGRAKDLGYWIVKVMCHVDSYWFLVKTRSPKEPIFVGKKNRDYIELGPLGSPDAVFAAIQVLGAMQDTGQDEEEQGDE